MVQNFFLFDAFGTFSFVEEIQNSTLFQGRWYGRVKPNFRIMSRRSMIGHGLPVILVLMQFGSITRSTNEDWGLHPEWCLFFHGWLSPTTEWASSRRTPCVRPYCRGWLMSRTLDDVPCSILCCNSDYVRTVHYRVRFIWAFLFSFFFFLWFSFELLLRIKLLAFSYLYVFGQGFLLWLPSQVLKNGPLKSLPVCVTSWDLFHGMVTTYDLIDAALCWWTFSFDELL